MIDKTVACSCKYKETFNKQSSPMIIINAKTGKINDANLAACDYYSYSKEELLAMNISDINILTKEEILKEINEVKVGNKKLLRFKHKLSSGEIRDVEVYSGYLKIGNQDLLSSIIHDVKEKTELEKQYKKNKEKDFLTGLFSRKFFLENLTNEIIKKTKDKDTKEKLAVLMLGVNEFKEINDALGSLVGELLLKEFALRLRASVENENIIARFINDEFAIIIPNLKDLKEIDILTDSIIESLRDLFFIELTEIQLTTNIGVSIYPDDGLDHIVLIRKAKIAMDESKKISENRVIKFKQSYDKEIQENFWMKTDLLKAMKDGELFLNYQPIYDIVEYELAGVEALIRWNHKEHGMISPVRFIPLAEETGMIHSIGEWVLIEACNQNRRWQELGYKSIWVSVNVSVLQLETPGFTDMIKRILKETMLDPKCLQLEITETYFTKNYKSIKQTIDEISQLGVRFAIDDFGTGYSSLGQLGELSINNLKIDRLFIDGVDRNIHNSKIVKAIISLADSLGIILTAEGVEREEELWFLKENNCTMVQGYLLSKPVGANEIEKILKI